MDITKLKPSKLIDIALQDMLACNNDSRYRVSMEAWHFPHSDFTGQNPSCEVCLAGAVMAKTLKAPRSIDTFPDNYSETTRSALHAINAFRVGWGDEAFDYLRLGSSRGAKFNRVITPWSESKSGFVDDLCHLSLDLEAAGY